MMKIFKLNDIEWWAGESLEQVKQFCLDEAVVDEEEAFDDPRELTDEELDRLQYVEDVYSDEKNTRPFREELARMVAANESFPCLFASTEY